MGKANLPTWTPEGLKRKLRDMQAGIDNLRRLAHTHDIPAPAPPQAAGGITEWMVLNSSTVIPSGVVTQAAWTVEESEGSSLVYNSGTIEVVEGLWLINVHTQWADVGAATSTDLLLRTRGQPIKDYHDGDDGTARRNLEITTTVRVTPDGSGSAVGFWDVRLFQDSGSSRQLEGDNSYWSIFRIN